MADYTDYLSEISNIIIMISDLLEAMDNDEKTSHKDKAALYQAFKILHDRAPTEL
jgi:hypothetical protein